MENEFLIPLNGLSAGKIDQNWQVGIDFFRRFENSQVIDADVLASVKLEKIGPKIGVELLLDGTLTLECDRCLEDLIMPINESVTLTVMFEELDEDNDDEDIICIEKGSTDLDLSQVIYDYSCLALPIQRFHREGECNLKVVEILEEGITIDSEEEEKNNPFSKLKEMFEN